MKLFEIGKNFIKIYNKEDFNPTHILECGQVFCYQKEDGVYNVFPEKEYAQIEEFVDCYLIKTNNPDYFVEFFDLKNDYTSIKNKLLKFDILKEPINFGGGIRILKQNLFEMLISFIISSNNNIKRIQLILSRLRENLGEKIDKGYAFPTYDKLLTANQDFFVKIGAGYRATYLFKVLRQVNPEQLENWRDLPTEQLRKKLLSLIGVGPKVADCILLFGYGRGDVFPVDTWIFQMYNTYYPRLENREKIRENLVHEFKDLSGYAQQYLFYYQRSNKE